MAPNPLPTATIIGASTVQPFIGNSLDLTVRFDNASATDVGYAPYVNIVLPANGADGAGAGTTPENDGIDFVSAKYLGLDLESWVVEFNASGQAVHPFLDDATGMPLVLSGTPGSKLLVLRLPFGSFTPDQTPVDIALKLAVSQKADVYSAGNPASQLNIQVTPGFAYGTDPFNNPCCDPPVTGSPLTLNVQPTVATLTKTYIGPEQETATGPSYEREWVVQGDFAPGQSFTNVKLTDTMPDGTVVTGAHLEVNGTTIATAAVIKVNADGTTTVTGSFPGTITGGTQVPKLVIDFYVTELLHDGTPVLDPDKGTFRQLDDNARLDANWTPIDTRDPAATITIDPVGPENTITAKSIAVQKGVALISSQYQPNGKLEYTLDGQVSNYFEMKGLVLKDTLGDGQTFDGGFAPTLSVSEGGVTKTVSLAGFFTVGAKDGLGKTPITFDVSGAMQAAGLDDVLDGNGGSLGGTPHAEDYQPATIQVKFRTTLDKTWTNPATQDPMVDQGDPVGNTIKYGGQVDATGLYIEDDSGAGITLPVSKVAKAVYAINGDVAKGTTAFDTPAKVQSGDLITYRLSLDMPLTSAHKVSLTDYLPLPVLSAADPDANGTPNSFVFDGVNSAPAVGHFSFGPADQFHVNVPGKTPTLSVDGTSNAIKLDFGDVTNAAYPATKLDLLFTVRVGDAPFGDGLYLTNLVTSAETNSFNTPSQDNAIIQIQLGEPRLKITKGVVGTTNSGSSFDAAVAPSGVSFGAPGSSGAAFTGTINSAALDATPVNANLNYGDAGDTVRFAIILENKGQGWKGAFDTLVRDDLPDGYVVPAGGLNLKVTYGDGTSVPYVPKGTGLFDPNGGVQLTDSSLISGCIGTYNPTSGKNVVVISYDLQLATNVGAPNPALTNTATIVNYAAEEGGTNRKDYDDLPDSDTASVSLLPQISKVVTGTSLADTDKSQGDGSLFDTAIGEVVTYTVTVKLPEGKLNNLVLDDLLPTSGGQMKAISATITQVGGNLVFSSGNPLNTTATLSDSNADGVQDKLAFNLGNVTNTPDNVNDGKDSITFQVVAQVTKDASNTAGDVLTNTARVTATNPDTGKAYTQSATAKVEVVEPHLTIDKSVSPGSGDAGDTVTYTVVLKNEVKGFDAPAYDLQIDDVLSQLGTNADYVPGSVNLVSGPAGTTIVTGKGAGEDTIRIAVPQLNPGQSVTLTYRAKLEDHAVAGAKINNTASYAGSSLPGTDAQERPYTGSDTAQVTVKSPSATKVITATSYADTGTSQPPSGNPDLKPGEVATYTITIRLPEGDSPNLKVVDTLADVLTKGTSGLLEYVPGSAKVVSVGSNITLSGVPTITPANANNANGTTEQITFLLGNAYNAPDNVNDSKDEIVLELQARAKDVASNEDGDVLTNTAVITTTNTSTTKQASADFVEPKLLVDKSANIASGDAGDIVTYTVSISHASNSHVNAYDLDLADLLVPGLVLLPGNVTTTLGSASDAGGKVTLHVDQYDLGSAPIVLTYKAKLADSVVHNASLVNTASLDYQSSSFAQDATGGRQYSASDTATVNVAMANSVAKSITATDDARTSGSNLAIGETATFTITATVAEGTQKLVVTDVLPADMTYVSSSVVSLGALTNSTLSAGASGSYNALTRTVTFDFGSVTNPGDNLAGNNTVTLQVLAKVAGTAYGTEVLTNTAAIPSTVGPNSYGVAPGTSVPGNTTTASATVLAANVGDTAFVDKNGNGIQDSGEQGLDGVTIKLVDTTTGTVVDQAVTSGGGKYLFKDELPGSYRIEAVAPTGSGYVFTTQGNGSNPLDSDVKPTDGKGYSFTLPNGANDLTHDVGLYIPVKIGDLVFLDVNGNGLQDGGAEVGIKDVVVTLLNGSGGTVGTTKTDVNGNYLFDELIPGEYQVKFTAPAGYTITPANQGNDALDSDADASGLAPKRTYVSGDDDRSIDLGLYVPATLGDYAFIDNNGNGIQDAGDTPLSGVKVELYDSLGTLKGTRVTGLDGSYGFTDLRPGTYSEKFILPANYVFSPAGQGTAATDSDPNPLTGKGPNITLVSGQNDDTHDVGAYIPAVIGDYAFDDLNANGIQDAGDKPLQGVKVELVNKVTGLVVATAFTDASGAYSFTVPPGTYFEQFTAPVGSLYMLTKSGQGTPATDSDALDFAQPSGRGADFSVKSGGSDLTHDVGFFQPVKIGDYVFEDQNGNGLQDSGDTVLEGVTVQLLDSGNTVLATTKTDASGLYTFGNLPPGDYHVKVLPPAGFVFTLQGAPGLGNNSTADAGGITPVKSYLPGVTDLTVDAGLYRPVTIGDYAWVDVNGNGIQDGTEPGLEGVKVKLVNEGTGAVYYATTDKDGAYSFTGLPPGTYHEEFTGPFGYKLTITGQGTPETDSDPNPVTGVGPSFSIRSGDVDNTRDAGFYVPVKVKGSVFLDTAPGLCADKVADAVFAGITVNLVDLLGTVVSTTTTGSDGTYTLIGAPGTYQVQFVLPAGLAFTTKGLGQVGNGSDADAATGLTDAFTLPSGGVLTGEDAGLRHLTGTTQGLQPTLLPGGSYTFSTPVGVEFTGSATVNLNAGGNTILGGDGSLTVSANAGGNILVGGTGFAILHGGPNGGGVMMGGQGGAIIEGTSSNDIIIGGCGAINAQGLGAGGAGGSGGGMLANLGGDLMIGGKGNDTLEFNNSSGTVYGGGGDDFIHAAGNGVVLAGGTNGGTISWDGTQFSGLRIGDTVNGSGANTTFLYQAGDGVQWLENFNPAAGDVVEVWGFAGPTATGMVNGYAVLYFGPNQALVFNGWQPQNGPLSGIVYHPESAVAPGAIDHISPQVPVVLSGSMTSFYGTQGDDIAVGSDVATSFKGMGGNDYLVGGAGNDSFQMGPGNNTALGNGGDDTFFGALGNNDAFAGGSGADKVSYSFSHNSAQWQQLADGRWEIIKSGGGVDLLSGVEKVQFTDGQLNLVSGIYTAALISDPDFNGDGKGDLLFRHNDGTLYVWQMDGTSIAAAGTPGSVPLEWQVVGAGDFNADTKADLLWRNDKGGLYLWQMNGPQIAGGGGVLDPGSDWTVSGIGDFDGDGKADILWRNNDGYMYLWSMNGTAMVKGTDLGSVPNDWHVSVVADFTGDKQADILWQRETDGALYMWTMQGGVVTGQGLISVLGHDWKLAGYGDLDGDKKADLVFENANTGDLYAWLMNGTGIASQGVIGTLKPGSHVQLVEDLDGDLKADIIMASAGGEISVMQMNGLASLGTTVIGNVGTEWHMA